MAEQNNNILLLKAVDFDSLPDGATYLAWWNEMYVTFSKAGTIKPNTICYKLPNEQLDIKEWQPIETAPKDGTYILVTAPKHGGAWVAKYTPRYTSGYVPKNKWTHMMLNVKHLKGKREDLTLIPTHWMPMPQLDPITEISIGEDDGI